MAALRERGYRVTQATVSRDITEMGLLKRDLPVDVRESRTLLAIRAVPGTAHAIAAALDRARWPDVLGTIAGDDTLFVACADAAAVTRTRQRLLRLGH